MEKVYTLRMVLMNGVVPMVDEISSYSCKELRDTVRKKLEEVNKESIFPVSFFESETYVYESIGEVPIMNDKNTSKDEEDIHIKDC